MPTDPNTFAEMVALTIKAALTPVLERVASLEAHVKQALAVEPSVTALRDRVVAVETKAAVQMPQIPLPDPIDLAPILERVAAAEARLSVLGDLRDRVVVVETKAMAPLVTPEPYPDTLTPVLERLAVADAKLARAAVLELTVIELKDRLLAMETKAAMPIEAHHEGPSAADLELKVHAAVEPVKTELSHLHERVAVMEVRAQIPGPSGHDGKDGQHGKDGADGLGFDDMDASFDGDRTLTLKFQRGDKVKSWPVVLPYQRNQGVYIDGKVYAFGDVVTWGGSQWHCNEDTTTKPGEGSKAWTLIVKRGRDGKDGRDAQTVPVVSVRKRED